MLLAEVVSQNAYYKFTRMSYNCVDDAITVLVVVLRVRGFVIQKIG